MIKYNSPHPNDEELIQKLRDEHVDSHEKAHRAYENFATLLDTLSTVEERTKALWRQIYENAVEDRRNASLMWTDLYIRVHGKAEEHAIHGMVLSKYIERMSKANDQLVKLTELVSEASNASMDEIIDPEDIYDQLNKK